jgi:hypothetical protein
MADLGLVISLWNAAPKLPDALANKLRGFASSQDVVLAQGIEANPAGAGKDKNVWSSGYGGSGGEAAGRANNAMLRYRQAQLDPHRKRVVAAADLYLTGAMDLRFPVYPGTAGKVIILMLNAHELTGDAKYLARADELARQANKLFLDGCPLPRAAHTVEHYEAITEGDTLMMALLQLWAVRQQPPVKLSLIYTDR